MACGFDPRPGHLRVLGGILPDHGRPDPARAVTHLTRPDGTIDTERLARLLTDAHHWLHARTRRRDH
ncbi:MAG: hypothetical protein AAFZ07_15585 [Actinomycetota bacterium]